MAPASHTGESPRESKSRCEIFIRLVEIKTRSDRIRTTVWSALISKILDRIIFPSHT